MLFDEVFPGFHMIGKWTKQEALIFYRAGLPYLIDGDCPDLMFKVGGEWVKVARK